MPRGHCHDWFRKWKREHNFCGLRPQDAKEMDQYIDLTEKIAGNGAGMDEDFVHDHFTAGAARPLLRCKDDTAYEKSLNYVVSCLKREETITGGDLQATIDGFLGKKKSTQMREETQSVPVEESTQMRTSGQDSEPISEKEPQSEKTVTAPPLTPGAQTLTQKYGGKDGADHPAPAPITDTGKVSIDTLPCREGKPCPDPAGRNFLKKQEVLGDKCESSGRLLRDIEYCPILERERRKAAGDEGEQLHRASTEMQMARTDPKDRPLDYDSANPSTQGIPRIAKQQPPPVQEIAQHTRDFVGDLPHQSQETLKNLCRMRDENDPRELIIALLDEEDMRAGGA